jgi:drug/metabolite transporter (DMT)-like permease
MNRPLLLLIATGTALGLNFPPRQTRYVAAAVGAGIGVIFLGESYPISMWIGAGIVLSTLGQMRSA